MFKNNSRRSSRPLLSMKALLIKENIFVRRQFFSPLSAQITISARSFKIILAQAPVEEEWKSLLTSPKQSR